ncbi:MAG: M10 family metallopeptidase C-terminal domain-containing protein [Acuticoccus sp.]
MGSVTDAIDANVALSSSSVTVYFARDGETVDFITNEGGWTAYERSAAMAALDAYAAVANLTFAETAMVEDATFRLTKSPSPHGSLGFMNGPDPAASDVAGIAWFNSGPYWGGPTSGLLDPGSYTFTIFLHEFGHGLGLAHPHETAGGSTIMPSIGTGYGLDQGVYTVMTYNDGWPEAPEGVPPSRAWGWNLGPSAIDIAVIQEKYGANPATATGDDRYVLPDANESGAGYLAIWDAGGVDTIASDGTADAMIDLREATLKAEVGGGGWVSHASGIHGGFTIANGVLIENAEGGGGNDSLVGNGADNDLYGRAGNDEIAGGGGSDKLVGGRGADALNGEAGDDALKGKAGADTVKGGGGDDALIGGNGEDRMFGNRGNDTLSGGRDDDRLEGGAGHDVLAGGGDDDTLMGDPGDDLLQGERGNDALRGGGGSDTLVGGLGRDTLFGGRGDDVFVFGPGDGHDTVERFGGGDRLDLTAFDLPSFAALDAAMDEVDGWTEVALDGVRILVDGSVDPGDVLL